MGLWGGSVNGAPLHSDTLDFEVKSLGIEEHWLDCGAFSSLPDEIDILPGETGHVTAEKEVPIELDEVCGRWLCCLKELRRLPGPLLIGRGTVELLLGIPSEIVARFWALERLGSGAPTDSSFSWKNIK